VTGPFGRELGVGVGWRREIAAWVDRNTKFHLVEVMAEDFAAPQKVPPAIDQLIDRGARVVPHSVSLSLAGAERPDLGRLRNLGALARRVGAPLVSDHIAFVRCGRLDSGHLLPPPRTQAALDVLVENVRIANRHLPVPLALENIACLFQWPGAEMDEATFIRELLVRTDTLLLLDVANLYANAVNFGWDYKAFLDEMPLDRLAYVHVAGGQEANGFYRDTHAHAVSRGPLEVLEDLATRCRVPGIILERDDRFPPTAELEAETDVIRESALRGTSIREGGHA